ncbi:MAG: hypothetical protein IIC73_01215 [Armatimonadetes bacterium]|nr:hypothetical protein [Armatimonadota bacterium]
MSFCGFMRPEPMPSMWTRMLGLFLEPPHDVVHPFVHRSDLDAPDDEVDDLIVRPGDTWERSQGGHCNDPRPPAHT